MKKVTFVCTGNTCRSPMAEAIAKALCENKNVIIESRGILGNGSNASENALEVSLKYNLNLENHKSKSLSKDDLESNYLILTMTNEHRDLILYNFPEYAEKVCTIYKYVLNEDKDIKDPFGSDLSEYIDCFEEISYLIKKIDFDKI